VHINPMHGEDDFSVAKEYNLRSEHLISPDGIFKDGDYKGLFVMDANSQIIKDLKERNILYAEELITHDYPHCWRCGTKCLFRLEDNWFIKIDAIRSDLKREAEKVKWMPEFVGKRMQDWLDNMGDWMISRKRFYGLALPFYECKKCGNLHVVGGKEELKEVAVNPDLVDKLPSIHRPWIDDIKIKCPKCGEVVERVQDVGDCWLDAGVVPFSTLKYLEDREYWEQWYPAEFVVEMIEQVRLWFYSMLVFGVVFEDSKPHEKVLGFAEVRDENNQRMSKTAHNYIPLDEASDKVGTDLIRWNFLTAAVGANIRFGFSILDDIPLWNTYNYFVTYAKLHDWDYEGFDADNVEHVMDRWIISKVRKLVMDVEKSMDEYNMATSSRDIEDFIRDLSQWYIRRSRDRFKRGDFNAIGTLHYVLLVLSKLLAPFVPFVSDEIYSNIAVNLGLQESKSSVHLEDYPQFKKEDVDEDLLENMVAIRSVCSNGLKAREAARLNLRQPLNKAYIGVDEEFIQDIIKNELNLKEVEYSKEPVKEEGVITVGDNDLFVSLDTNLTKRKGDRV